MGFTTVQKSDEAVVALDYDYHVSGGIESGYVEFVTAPVRIRRPVAAVIACLRSGGYVGNSYDVLLDVWIQSRFGDSWFDVLQFPRLGTDGGSTNNAWIQKLSASSTAPRVIMNSSDLVGGNSTNMIGEEWRVRYRLFGEASTTAYQFGVHIIPVG